MFELSIIIPVYNNNIQISYCLNSVINQTIGLEHMEIIIINDCSTDGTYEQLALWEEKCPKNIKLINLEQNVGVGAARNIGLYYATAEHVTFVDSDDILEPHMYETLYKNIKGHNCDLGVCRAKKHRLEQIGNVSMGRTGKSDCIIDIGSQAERKEFIKKDLNLSVWNKVYKKDLLLQNKIYFPEGFIYEDILFSELVKHYASRIYIVEEYLYHHIERSTSLSNNTSDWTKRLHRFWIEEIKMDELKERNLYESYKQHYDEEYIVTYITVIKNFINTYGSIPLELLTEINQYVLNRHPNYTSIALVKKLLCLEVDNFYYHILSGLGKQIDTSFISRLTDLAK